MLTFGLSTGNRSLVQPLLDLAEGGRVDAVHRRDDLFGPVLRGPGFAYRGAGALEMQLLRGEGLPEQAQPADPRIRQEPPQWLDIADDAHRHLGHAQLRGP